MTSVNMKLSLQRTNFFFLFKMFIVFSFVVLALHIYSERSVDYSTMSSKELFELGQYYFNHGDRADGSYDLDRARFFYTQSLQLGTQRLTWYQLGRIDFLEGRNDDAIAKFRKQQELYGDLTPNSYYMLGLTYGFKAMHQDDPQSWLYAEKYFIDYIRIVSHAPWPAVDLAWVYFMQGDYESMKPLLEDALARHPDNPWLLNMYGLALLNLKDNRAEAVVYFERAKEMALLLSPNDWGNVYPGNNPLYWEQGLDEFVATIDKNINVANSSN
jgi:tetratricopeptide (TPR) repeat protein